MVMVKPALPDLDVISELRETFAGNFYFGCEPDDSTTPLATRWKMTS